MADDSVSETGSNGKPFIIEELLDTDYLAEGVPANSNQTPGVTITWTQQGRSKPRESWKIKKTLRTVRTDYSGTPTEQILGVKFEDFTLSGIWDNRHNGGFDADYAWTMKETIEGLHARGNKLRFRFDDISIEGVLKNYEFDFKRRNYIGYTLTVSPHNNTKDTTDTKPPSIPTVPQDIDQKTRSLIAQAQAVHTNSNIQAYMAAGVVQTALFLGVNYPPVITANSVYGQISNEFGVLGTISDNITNIIENRVAFNGPLGLGKTTSTLISTPNATNLTSLQRLVQEYVTMREVATAMIESMKINTPDSDIIYPDAGLILAYQDWHLGMKYYLRQLIQTCSDAEQQFGALIAPNVLTVYRPQAEESLYEIADQFYGSPTQWPAIYSYNKLRSLVLNGDEFLIIPKLV